MLDWCLSCPNSSHGHKARLLSFILKLKKERREKKSTCFECKKLAKLFRITTSSGSQSSPAVPVNDLFVCVCLKFDLWGHDYQIRGIHNINTSVWVKKKGWWGFACTSEKSYGPFCLMIFHQLVFEREAFLFTIYMIINWSTVIWNWEQKEPPFRGCNRSKIMPHTFSITWRKGRFEDPFKLGHWLIDHQSLLED